MKDNGKIVMAAGHYHYFHRTAPFVASEKGFFRDEGLADFEIIATGEDEHTIEGLKRGTIHFGLDVAPWLFLQENANGKGLYLIGSMINGLRMILIGIRSIKSVEDLKGKRIHVPENGNAISERQLRVLLRKRGLDPDKDVTIVRNAPHPCIANAEDSFNKGEVDARPLFYIELPEVVRLGYSVLHDFAETYPDGYLQRGIITTNEMIDKYPHQIKAFLRGMIRGYRFVRRRENLSEIMRILREFIKEKEFGFKGFNPVFLEKYHYPFSELPIDGNITIRGLQAYIDEEIADGKLPQTFTIDQVTRLQFVKEACREVDERFGPYGYE